MSIIYLLCNEMEEEIIFQYTDFYVTSRGKETIKRTCYADLYHIPIISGVDVPAFQ